MFPLAKKKKEEDFSFHKKKGGQKVMLVFSVCFVAGITGGSETDTAKLLQNYTQHLSIRYLTLNYVCEPSCLIFDLFCAAVSKMCCIIIALCFMPFPLRKGFIGMLVFQAGNFGFSHFNVLSSVNRRKGATHKWK